jgi:hypothetical protein
MSTSTYPVRVDASLQPGLSRWLWLVKWLLVLVAAVVLLATGTYPRAIFDLVLGLNPISRAADGPAPDRHGMTVVCW